MELPKDFLAKIESEIEAGLPREQDRRLESLRALRYYNRQGHLMVPRRDAESYGDYQARIKRSLPITNRVIRVLTSKLYHPGPSRRLEATKSVQDWLDQVYARHAINALWQRADRMSHLLGVAAFQVGASGDPEDPITLHLWSGRHELALYERPGKANELASVVTIDCVDEQTRYTWWTDQFYKVYLTRKLKDGQTAGGRTAKYAPELSGPNPYGILPFAFCWYERPINGFDHIHGLGEFLANLNESIDVEMSDMANAVSKYHSPQPIAYDCGAEFQPIVAPGKWIRVNSQPTMSDMVSGSQPRLEFLQASLDITGGWDNIRNAIDSELEALGVPLTSYRMDTATLPSGDALVAEQKPLSDYAEERQEPFKFYEADLKRVVLTVGGQYYHKPELLAAAKAPLSLTWPPKTIDLPGPARDQQDQASLDMGLESLVMVVMRRFSCTRDEAMEHLQQVLDDTADLQEMRKEVMGEEQTEQPADESTEGEQAPNEDQNPE